MVDLFKWISVDKYDILTYDFELFFVYLHWNNMTSS